MITKIQLPARLGHHPGPSLYCDQCGEHYSADKGDYFYVADDYKFVCDGDDCDRRELRLVVTRVVVEDWEAA